MTVIQWLRLNAAEKGNGRWQAEWPLNRRVGSMTITHVAAVYDYLLSFLVEKATPREILAFEIPASERQRALELLEKQDAGTLTPAEVEEVAQMQQIDRLVSALKAKALAASRHA